MTVARVAGLFVHPIKSAAAIAVARMTLDARGAVGDRRWLVIQPDGAQITARETPALAMVRPQFVRTTHSGSPDVDAVNLDGPLDLSAPGMDRIRLELPLHGNTRRVVVWDDTIDALDAGDAVAEWMSAAIGTPCRLVRLAPEASRPLAARYSGPLNAEGRHVAFTDGAPLLILGQASVEGLNARIVSSGGEPMTVARFRPNILVSGTGPHEEDQWHQVQIGSVTFGVGKQCERCVMTTIDPLTGKRGLEPLRTLATYRRQGGQVMFGMNATHHAPGVVSVGDSIAV